MKEFTDFIRSRHPVTMLLVLVNVIVFLVLSSLGDTEDAYFMFTHGACFAPSVVLDHEYYRLITGMFLHFGAEHLFYNMLMLIFLGDTLEKYAGKLRYLLICIIGGAAGNIVSVIFDWKTEKFAVSAGASGLVFAVIGGLVCVVVVNRGRLEEYSASRLLMMAVLSIAEGFTATGIDNCAHVGGFAAGFLTALLFWRKLRRKETKPPAYKSFM